MDWNKVNQPATRKADARSATLLEQCWRLRAPTGRVVTCGIYHDEHQALRCASGYGEDDLLRSQLTEEIGTVRKAADWGRANLAKGWFTDVTEQGT